jgi:hypothetical protein
MVFAGEDAGDLLAGVENGGGGVLGFGEFLFEEDGREDYFCPFDAEIVGAVEHGGFGGGGCVHG